MRGVIMYAPGDLRVEERGDPRIIEPRDAMIRVSAACICGSDSGRTAGSRHSMGRYRWATSTSGSPRKSVPTS